MANWMQLLKRGMQNTAKTGAREADEILAGELSTLRKAAPIASEVVEDATLVAPKYGMSSGPLDRLLRPEAATLALGTGYLGSQMLDGGEAPPEAPVADMPMPEVNRVPTQEMQMPAVPEKSEQEKVIESQIRSLRAKPMAPMVIEGESIGTQENLQAAQKATRDAKQVAQLGRAGELLGSAISGAKPVGQEMFKDLEKSAESIEADFQDLIKNEKNDPNSTYSQGLKEYLKRAGLEVKGELTGETVAKLMPYAVRQYESDLARETKRQMLEMGLAQKKDAAREAGGEKSKQAAFKQSTTLQNIVNRQTKQTQDTFDNRRELADFLEEAAKKPTGKGFQDVAITYGFIKGRDNTAVREGEQALLKAAGSIPDQLRRSLGAALRGEAYNAADMQALRALLQRENAQVANTYRQRIAPIVEQAKRNGLDESDVISRPDIYGYQAPSMSAGKVKVKDSVSGRVKMFDEATAQKLLKDSKYQKVE